MKRPTPRIAPVIAERRRQRADVTRRRRLLSGALTASVVACAAAFSWHDTPEIPASLEYLSAVIPTPRARASADAFGKSGELLVRLAMPGSNVEYPLEVHGDPAKLSYQWIRSSDSSAFGIAQPLGAAEVPAPTTPGFYRLAVGTQDAMLLVEGITVAVMVPFERKLGNYLNGYRIGTYLGERFGGESERPAGFLEVYPRDAQIRLTKHLRVADFLTHDDQRSWPRYVAISTNLLDKLELVAAQVASLSGFAHTELKMDINSGFRTPEHNRGVKRAARDSRHQYGDAADVVIDANGDGRFTDYDSRMVALAVELVERNHPDLSGGLGVYTSRRYHTPYVHIDARGRRARWRG
jgi:uncharacterized protein YcbK (DUF882 family)